MPAADGPIVFISRSRIRPGRVDELRAFLEKGSAVLVEAKPQTQAFLAYVDEDSMTLTIVHVFADSAGFAAHVQGADQRSNAAARYIETIGMTIYGHPAEPTVTAIRSGLDAGVPVEVRSNYVGGFLRSAAR